LLAIRHLLPGFDLLVLERSFVAGAGNEVGLFGVSLTGAQDVAGLADLPDPFPGRTATKTPLLSLRRAGLAPDNLEAMALGPRLPNGRASLLLLSDDNLSATQRNQFLLFELDAGVAGGLPRTGGAAGAPLPTPAPLAPTALAAAVLGLGARRRNRRGAARRLRRRGGGGADRGGAPAGGARGGQPLAARGAAPRKVPPGGVRRSLVVGGGRRVGVV
jgi:hypothetical protein